MNKQIGVSIVILILMLNLIVLVSSVDEISPLEAAWPTPACDIIPASECAGVQRDLFTIFRLSSLENAHVEVFDQNNYAYVLCCNFGNGIQPNECNANNGEKIIGITNLTNAHASLPESSSANYVCYDATGFTCEGGASPSDNSYNPILSLSGTSNAHVGTPNSYANKIWCNVTYLGEWCGNGITNASTGEQCDDGVNNSYSDSYCTEGCQCKDSWTYNQEFNICQQLEGSGDPIAYWTNNSINPDSTSPLTEGIAQVGSTTVYLVLENSGYSSEDTTPVFSIYSEAGWLGSDVYLKDVTGSVYGTASLAIASWTISNTDIENANSNDFYFTVDDASGNTRQSGTYSPTISQSLDCNSIIMCGDYIAEDTCNNDANYCAVAPENIYQNTGGSVTCADPDIDCSCSWNVTTSLCGPVWSASYNGNSIGTCSYSETTDDNCDDRFYTYSWTGLWNWATGNMYDDEGSCLDAYDDEDESTGSCIEMNGKYYYDPQEMNTQCIDGENVVPCPSKIQLQFFNLYNFIAVIILIIIIYLIVLNNKKFSKKSKKPVLHKKKK